MIGVLNLIEFRGHMYAVTTDGIYHATPYNDGIKIQKKIEIYQPDYADCGDVLSMSIDHLPVSEKTKRGMALMTYFDGIRYVGDLVQISEAKAKKYRHIGKVAISEINEALSSLNLKFGMSLHGWNRPCPCNETEIQKMILMQITESFDHMRHDPAFANPSRVERYLQININVMQAISDVILASSTQPRKEKS